MRIQGMLVVLLALFAFVGKANAYTREEVITRGFLRCGVSNGLPGFSSIDGHGRWSGLDVDICRAVAAATLGDAEKVKFLPLADGESFTALLTGEVDILSRHSIWTFSSESALAVHFAGVSYYDGQGILLPKKLNVTRLDQLRSVKVCSYVDSAFERNLVDNLERNKVDYKIIAYESADLAVEGFKQEACDLITMQKSKLHGLQLGFADPDSVVILPESIAKEPLGPVVRQDDDTWLNIVKWSLFAMINGEELGVTSSNIKEMKLSVSVAVRRLLGLEGAGGKGLGLPDDWAVEILGQVGNYGEVFEKNFGSQSTLKIERGLNNLWNQGGLQYAPPMQ